MIYLEYNADYDKLKYGEWLPITNKQPLTINVRSCLIIVFKRNSFQ